MVGEVKTFNNCNANEDHSWGIKWENNDDILEYDYKTLKSRAIALARSLASLRLLLGCRRLLALLARR